MQETWVQSLGLEDPLEEEMKTHSSILVWEIPRTEEPGRLQSMELQKTSTQCILVGKTRLPRETLFERKHDETEMEHD